MKFSSLLRRWRKAAALSQSAAALHLGVPLKTLQSWEQGDREPKPMTIEALKARGMK